MAKKKKDWHAAHQNNVDTYARQVHQLYLDLLREAVRIQKAVNYDNQKPFSFSNYPTMRDRTSKLFTSFSKSMVNVITDGSKREWAMSNAKNNELLQYLFRNSTVPEELINKLKPQNAGALASFLSRKEKGLNLSDKVWKYVEQGKANIENALTVGIAKGTSSNYLAAKMMQYLQTPSLLEVDARQLHKLDYREELLRRIDSLKPGVGTYRSSYANSLRLVRTETNMAYQLADHETYNSWDFVVGIEVRRSNNPFPCPVCETLKGKYPKTFKFRSWHPNCRCHTIPILMTDEEFRTIELMMLNEEDTRGFVSENAVSAMPAGYNEWMSINRRRLINANSTPYFIFDNFHPDDIKSGLRVSNIIPVINNLADISTLTKQGKTIQDVFYTKNTGEWHPSRAVLHNQITEKYLTGNFDTSDTVYMLGGAPANGKSTLLDSGLLPHPKNGLTVDPDKVKGMIPEYKKMLSSGKNHLIEEAANFVHEESSHIGKKIQKTAIQRNIALVIDGVNDGDFDKLVEKVEGIKKASGKKIRADYVSLDSELSIKLAQLRAKATGRNVPLRHVALMNSEISKLIPKLLDKKVFDELYLWDTNIEGKPRLILAFINGEIKEMNTELYQRFLSKAVN